MSSNPFLFKYDHLKSIYQPLWYQQLLQPLSVFPVFILASLWTILCIAASHFFKLQSGWSMVWLLSWQYTRSTVWPNLLPQFHRLLLSWVSALWPHIALLYFLNVPFLHPPLLVNGLFLLFPVPEIFSISLSPMSSSMIRSQWKHFFKEVLTEDQNWRAKITNWKIHKHVLLPWGSYKKSKLGI